MKYPKFKIFTEKEKEDFLKKLKGQFGIEKIEGMLLQRGAERVFLYSGEMRKADIINLENNLPVERVGIYFAKIFQPTGEIRLSIEGTQMLKEQIKKNIFELNEEQLDEWMKGRELNLSSGMKGFVIMKYKNDFLGCGKASQEKISNFIPKNRRLKEKG